MKIIVALGIISLLLQSCYTSNDTPVQILKTTQPSLIKKDGSYDTVPLEKDVITLTVVQSGVKSLKKFSSITEGLEYNLNHMIGLARKACSQEKKPDILLFHEFPLTGYDPGSRTEKLDFALDIPGKESKALGEVAKECDTYIIYGSYAKDKDWPGHILSINTMLGRDGSIVKKFWKTRNIKRIYPDKEITTTTIEAVRDRYRTMYGIDEEFPVVRTEYGNIAVSTVQMDPFIFAAFAMKGTEIMIRTATMYAREDVLAMARTNNFYSAMSNIVFPREMQIPAGHSVIVSPQAKILVKEESQYDEAIISAQIPIAKFRKDRRIPNYALEMVQPIFEQYQQEIPINHLDLPEEKLPETGEAMKNLFDKQSRWIKGKSWQLD
ncbi:carbon-nitrogen hydrolase family protein [Colwellia sp. UCD-KL20]|uniref:carbon-nitrogen hydrolase family protein n=1 Tax=Colwellia sp. UCD-KL20 TaxID=1917165 RepID=UPI0009708E2F|nr:carbon-nitrogen hydrolase family protein [Colwellia sp. UCD-KL20]